MKILTKAAEIRASIRQILQDQSQERIVAVAYVAAGALSYLPSVKGLKLYCWPQAGGTSPQVIQALVNAGADVVFVEYLHAKVYWSPKGLLLGSANLSSSALGGVGLHEVVVQLPSGAMDVRAFVSGADPYLPLNQ
jgi:phosphatidylserine/phosphatidylglycerophosphate/cardiolipin synthase-like enzyme